MLTTKWDVVSHNRVAHAAALERQTELTTKHEFWGDILAKGGRAVALHAGTLAARQVLDQVISQGHSLVLNLQFEMVTESKRLHETSAGFLLRDHHQKELEKMEELLTEAQAELEAALRQHHDRNVVHSRQEIRRIRQRLENHNHSLDELNMTICEITTLAREVGRRERDELREMLEGFEAEVGPFVQEGPESRPKAIRAIQRRHLPSISVGDSANVISAVVGVASFALAAAGACTVM